MVAKWKLSVNLNKTKVVYFRPGPKTDVTTTEFVFGTDILEIVPQYKYIGLIFTEF